MLKEALVTATSPGEIYTGVKAQRDIAVAGGLVKASDHCTAFNSGKSLACLSRQCAANRGFRICARHARHYSQTIAGAVSSVVEHLVYTERVGGSKPSPPSFSIVDCMIASLSALAVSRLRLEIPPALA
jgi:hypothetical protein